MQSFPRSVAKVHKAHQGRTPVEATPLSIRAHHVEVDDELRDEIREQLAGALDTMAEHILRVSVRFEDVNGPKRGVDITCRVKVVLLSAPSLLAEERAATPLDAFRGVLGVIGRAVRRDLDRRGFTGKRLKEKRARGRGVTPKKRSPPRAPRPLREDDGSLIGRRVGQGKKNLAAALERPEKIRRDAFVDTAAPNTSASDRKAGFGATAARNTQKRTKGIAALEDSRSRPSRKSTRRSAAHMKSGTKQETTTRIATTAPKARAERAIAGTKGRSAKPR